MSRPRWSGGYDGGAIPRTGLPFFCQLEAAELAEVVSGGGEDGVDGIAVAVGEIVAADAVLILDVADDCLEQGGEEGISATLH